MKQLNLKTLWLLFGFIFLLGIGIYPCLSLFLMNVADEYFGICGRIVVGILALLGFFFIFLRNFYHVADLLSKRERDEARKKFRGIYRVLSLPTKSQRPNNWCSEEITVGDFGWEAKPLTKDGLVWLQGLTTEWKMAWRAGFEPKEIEFVCSKPVSQYDWKDFEYDGPKPKSIWTTAIPKHPCPFSIKKTPKYSRLHFPI